MLRKERHEINCAKINYEKEIERDKISDLTWVIEEIFIQFEVFTDFSDHKQIKSLEALIDSFMKYFIKSQNEYQKEYALVGLEQLYLYIIQLLEKM